MVPIHCGRALACEASKDGKMSEKDYQWMLDNMIGDDTGDNISDLNRTYNEMTAIYWAWKNYDKLGNPDYIGIMHYRTLFSLIDFFKPKNKKKLLESISLNKENLQKLLSNYNLVYKRKIRFSRKKDKNRIGFDWYNTQFGLSENSYPELFKKYKLFKADFAFSPKNMFIMQKDDFFKYCETIFPLMFKTQEQFKNAQGKYEIPYRYFAYAAEYLTSFYLDYLKEQSHINAIGIKTHFIYNKITYNIELLKMLLLIKLFNKKQLKNKFRCWYLNKTVE